MPGIHRVAVLGAGTMGAAIAGLCANAGLQVYLLDMVPETLLPQEAAAGLTLDSATVRNRLVRAGLERLQQSRPPALVTPAVAERITIGNFSDNWSWLAQADWIIEAIVERLEPKQALLARIELVSRSDALVSSNTSGIPLHAIAAGRSAALQRRFLGTHFFNPPRYMKLLEVIPTAATGTAVVERLRQFAEETLGKRTVLCNDTPGFIANRIGTHCGMTTMRYALEHGYSIEEVDALTGPLIGRPRTATYRLADLAGLDIMVGVANNLYTALPGDARREELRPPAAIERLVQAGRLGNKTGAGFYQRASGQRPVFNVVDLATLEYQPPRQPDLPWATELARTRDLAERLRACMAQAVAGNREAQLIEMAILPTLSYAAHCMPEITADIAAVDDAMRWGYGHDLGPFQVWDALGVAATATRLRQLGLEVAGWVEQLLASDQPAFYGQQGSVRTVYRPSSGQHEPLEQGAAYLDLAALKAAGKTVLSTTTASLIDLGDGVLCLEFHSKANAVGQEALHLLDQALDLLAEDPWRAMVIGNQGVYFCAGINLNELGAMAQATDPATMVSFLEKAHRQMQRLRFAPKPVVAAPFAQTMGLGVELSVACSAICAEADVAMGLVEAGVGLIPGGGGCKELVRRVVSPPMLTPGADPLPALRRVLEMVATAKVSTSAAEARDMGFLAASDRIVFGRDRLLAAAKQLALTLADAGYQPPTPGRSCYAAGETALAALVIDIHLLRAGGFITEYDAVIARTLAATLCGGALSAAQWVDEDYMLAQEREGFERLLSDERTQARIREFLKTGVRLRN